MADFRSVAPENRSALSPQKQSMHLRDLDDLVCGTARRKPGNPPLFHKRADVLTGEKLGLGDPRQTKPKRQTKPNCAFVWFSVKMNVLDLPDGALNKNSNRLCQAIPPCQWQRCHRCPVRQTCPFSLARRCVLTPNSAMHCSRLRLAFRPGHLQVIGATSIRLRSSNSGPMPTLTAPVTRYWRIVVWTPVVWLLGEENFRSPR